MYTLPQPISQSMLHIFRLITYFPGNPWFLFIYYTMKISMQSLLNCLVGNPSQQTAEGLHYFLAVSGPLQRSWKQEGLTLQTASINLPIFWIKNTQTQKEAADFSVCAVQQNTDTSVMRTKTFCSPYNFN